MGIPLNIDTPSGVEFTINKTIRVDSAGRIHVNIGCNPDKMRAEGNKIFLSFTSASHAIVLTLEKKDVRLMAYDILKVTE